MEARCYEAVSEQQMFCLTVSEGEVVKKNMCQNLGECQAGPPETDMSKLGSQCDEMMTRSLRSREVKGGADEKCAETDFLRNLLRAGSNEPLCSKSPATISEISFP